MGTISWKKQRVFIILLSSGSMKKRYHLYVNLFIFVLIVLLLAGSYYFSPLKDFFSSPEKIKSFFLSFGRFTPVALFFSMILSVPLPLPSSAINALSGFILGPLFGMVIAYAGLKIGLLVSFWLARRFGRRIVEKLTDKKEQKHFEIMFKKYGSSLILISFMVPIFPADIIGLLAGLTKIKFRHFALLVAVGLIPRTILLSLFGSELAKGFSMELVLIFLLVLAFGLTAVFRHQIKIFFVKEIQELEKKI